MSVRLATGDKVMVEAFGHAWRASVKWVSSGSFSVKGRIGAKGRFSVMTFAMDTEGHSWVRGWDSDVAKAFLAARALVA